MARVSNCVHSLLETCVRLLEQSAVTKYGCFAGQRKRECDREPVALAKMTLYRDCLVKQHERLLVFPRGRTGLPQHRSNLHGKRFVADCRGAYQRGLQVAGGMRQLT